jgi:glycerate 2-kinase
MGSDTGAEHVERILKDVVAKLDPRALVSDAITNENGLNIQGITDTLSVSGKLVVVAVGKASVPMAAGAIDSLGALVAEAVAITKTGIPLSVEVPDVLEVLESDHPVPSERSLDAGARVRSMVEDLSEHDTVLMLISGGGSALIEDLVDGVTLEDLRATTDHLLRAGATINELNAVRRRISRLKGGRLARAAAPARVVNLIVSDVLNSPLQDIASGPTVEPPETDETFASVMKRSDLVGDLPDSVRRQLDAQKQLDEPWTDNVAGTVILADARTAALAAVDSAVGLGYRIQTLGFDFQGEAREFGSTWATIARHATRHDQAFELPLALVGSGELTVTVRGEGTGGRNTEMALAAAANIDGFHNITICSFATDGDDGMSQCAGGVVDGATAGRIRSSGRDITASLNQNDSAAVLRECEATIDIGPTGTNVNDVYLALIQSPAESSE